MHVAGTQAEPVHRREVADGVGDLGVLHELGPRRGAGGEVEQQPVRRRGARVLGRRYVERVGVVQLLAGQQRVVAGHLVELVGVHRVAQHVARAAPGDPVGEVGGSHRGGRRHDHRADLHDREHRLPQLDLVAEHHDHGVPATDALPAEPGGHLVGAPGHLVVRALHPAAVLLDDHQRRPVVAAGDGVEPVDGPVEPVPEVGPLELRVRPVGVLAQVQQQVPGVPVALGRGHQGVPPRGVRRVASDSGRAQPVAPPPTGEVATVRPVSR